MTTQELPKTLHTNPDKLREKISQEEGVDQESVSTIALHWKVLSLDGACLCWSTGRGRRPWERAGFEGDGLGELERRALDFYPKPSSPSEALALYRRMLAEDWEQEVAIEFVHPRGYLKGQGDHPSSIEEGLDKIRALRAEGMDPAKIALWAISWKLGLEPFFDGVGLP